MMFDAAMLIIAIMSGALTGALCAEIPPSTAPAPVYRPQEGVYRPVEPARRPEPVPRSNDEEPQADEAVQQRKPFSVDFLTEQSGYSGPERVRHQTPQEAAAPSAVGYGYAPAPAQEASAPSNGYSYPQAPPQSSQAVQEVTYPDVAYAPGYGYEPSYTNQQPFDRYGNAVGYYEDAEPYSPPTTMGLLWSAMPDARGIANALGRALAWTLSSAFVVALGAALTVAICTFTGVCAVSFRGLTVTEQMRSLVSDERLQQLGTAAGILQKALTKYRAMQHQGKSAPAARRR